MIVEKLVFQRKLLGLSQQKLAELAAVSLPTVQNIERGVANPSLNVLNRLASALGLVLSIDPAPIDWDTLSSLGVPIVSSKKRSLVRRDFPTLLTKVRGALPICCNSVSNRKTEALAATLLALQTHWPSVFNQLGPLRSMACALIDRQDPERLLKLRSLAIDRLQIYL